MPAPCCKGTWLRIPDDEPVFILRGKDLLAPETVYQWVRIAELNKVNADKVQRAREHMRAMTDFQRDHPARCKLPD